MFTLFLIEIQVAETIPIQLVMRGKFPFINNFMFQYVSLQRNLLHNVLRSQQSASFSEDLVIILLRKRSPEKINYNLLQDSVKSTNSALPSVCLRLCGICARRRNASCLARDTKRVQMCNRIHSKQ